MQDKSFKIKDSGGFLSVQLKNIYLVPSVLGTVKLLKIIFSLARRSQLVWDAKKHTNKTEI